MTRERRYIPVADPVEGSYVVEISSGRRVFRAPTYVECVLWAKTREVSGSWLWTLFVDVTISFLFSIFLLLLMYYASTL